MRLEAIYHRPQQNWSFAYGKHTIVVRVRAKRNDLHSVYLVAGDKYAWEKTILEIPMNILSSDSQFDYWEAEVVPPFRRLAYCLRFVSGKQERWLSERGFSAAPPEPTTGFFEFPFINPVDVFAPPDWVKDAVFYQIFPERFANGDTMNDPKHTEAWGGTPAPDNFFGGDLKGVIDHLDYLRELGVNAIYFTPVFAAPTNHKYDTEDYLRVDPHFGTNATLKALVKACHQRGIRVMLDAVFNHCGKTFPPFVDVLQNGAKSRYAGWFHVREWPLHIDEHKIPTYDTFAFVPGMPKLNTENPEVREYLLNAARYWVEEAGIDGWRLDVANEVDHHFWRKFRETVKAANPDAYIVGEIWHDSIMWLQGDQFDAVMNYPFTFAAIDFFAEGTLDGKSFADAIGSQLAWYPRQVTEAMFNLLGSHDTPRLLTQCGKDKRRMKLAALFQLSFPGAPCIYYGDEIGLTGGSDPDCRKCMEWDASRQDRELMGFYQRAIAERRSNAAWTSPNLRFLYAKHKDRKIVYERFAGDNRWVFALNAGRRSGEVSLVLPSGSWMDWESGERLEAGGDKIRLRLPAFGYKVLRLAER